MALKNITTTWETMVLDISPYKDRGKMSFTCLLSAV